MPVSLAQVHKPTASKPPRLMLYSVAGLGKTTLATQAPAPIFIQTEDGLGGLDAATFGVLKDFSGVMEALQSLRQEEHDFYTVCVDSLDHLEPLIWAQACRDNKWPDIHSVPYGKGFAAAIDYWRAFLNAVDALRDEKGMAFIGIAHAKVTRFESPEHEPYDRYTPKLHREASALVQERMDCVLFGNYKVSTTRTDAGFNKKVVRGIGSGERVLYTEERPAFIAKQRYNLPPVIGLDWDELAAGIPYYAAQPSA